MRIVCHKPREIYWAELLTHEVLRAMGVLAVADSVVAPGMNVAGNQGGEKPLANRVS